MRNPVKFEIKNRHVMCFEDLLVFFSKILSISDFYKYDSRIYKKINYKEKTITLYNSPIWRKQNCLMEIRIEKKEVDEYLLDMWTYAYRTNIKYEITVISRPDINVFHLFEKDRNVDILAIPNHS